MKLLRSLAEARGLRDESRKMLSKGQDPVAEVKREKIERRNAETIQELVDDYLNKYAKIRKKTWSEDERILLKDVVPQWGERKAQDITRRDVKTLLGQIQVRGNGITLNTYKIIRKMFKYAVSAEIIPKSPCDGLTQEDDIPSTQSRERVLDDDEINTFWNGLTSASMSGEIKRALKLILVTCQRPGEVAAMHRSEIKGRWWEFTPKQTKITKEKPRQQRIYLTDLALKLIGDNEGYIFPSPNEGECIKERSIAYAIRRNLKGYTRQRPPRNPKGGEVAIMSKVKESRKFAVSHFTPHDLRRTSATLLAGLKFRDEVLDAILAHLKKGTIKTYNRHDYDAEKQEALIALEDKILRIVTGVSMKKRPMLGTKLQTEHDQAKINRIESAV